MTGSASAGVASRESGVARVTTTTSAADEDDDRRDLERASFLEKETTTTVVDSDVKPPDGGYGWVVVFAGFMVNLLGGCADTYGVFYMHFLDYFGESNSATAWPGAICYGFVLLAGPLASWLSHRFSHRTCCILGAIIGSAGLVITSWIRNLYVMYVTYGVVVGVGFCLQYLSATLIVGYYFEKRRTLAMCIGVTGVCIGDFIMPPLVERLMDYYSWQGAMMIEAGIALQACVFGSLMTPLKGVSTLEDAPSCDMSILRDFRFLLYCAGEAMWGLGCAVFFTIISDFAYFEGKTMSQGAWLLSVMAVSSAVSRIIVALLANGPRCDRFLLYSLSILMSIVPLVLLPYTRIYGVYILCSVLYGVGYGIICGLSPVIVADLFGLEQMTLAYGYVILFDGVSTTFGPPIAGRLFDITGNYEAAWLFCGACTLLGAVCCFTLITVNKISRKPLKEVPVQDK